MTRPPSVTIANGITMTLLLPQKELSLLQKIQAHYRQQQYTLIMQTQATPQQITMAGLTPTGTRLFSLTFDGTAVSDWKSPLFTAPFDGRYVLADFSLATFSLAQLRTALPNNVTLEENNHVRLLKNAQNTVVVRIEYRQQTTQYCHIERHYCLTIETL